MKRHPYYNETKDLLDDLAAAGYSPCYVHDGEERMAVRTWEEALSTVLSVDESSLVIKAPDGKPKWLFIVLGNSPGELVCDMKVDEALERIVDIHSAKWEK